MEKPAKVEPGYSVLYTLKGDGGRSEVDTCGYKRRIRVNPNKFDRALDVLSTPISKCPYHELSSLRGHDDGLSVYDRGNGMILVTSSGRWIKSIGFAGFDKKGLEKAVEELGLKTNAKG